MPQRHTADVFLGILLLVPAVAGGATLEAGVKAGMNLANFRGEFADVAKTETKLGFVGGPYVAYCFAPDLAIQVEALFSMKGAKTSTTGLDADGNAFGPYDTFYRLSYLEVPVLLRGTLLRTAAVQPMYHLGPALGIRLGGNMDSDPPGPGEQGLRDLKALDFGFAVGAGARFGVGGQKVLAELRYTMGFGDIYRLSDNLESINSVYSVTAGLAF